MFGYSMVKMVRENAHKLDQPLRTKILEMYKPFKWVPCFFHKWMEQLIKRSKKISVIVEFQENSFQEGLQEINHIVEQHKRCKVRKNFSIACCCSLDVTPTSLEKIMSNCQHVKKVYLNREVKALLNVAVPSANAQNIVRNGKKLTGKGVTVAVLDTGIYPHKDLSGRIIDFVDFINQRTVPYDDNGHGTHCAGDIAANGSSSSGKYRGPAPEANLIGVKVLDKRGSGLMETVMQGVEWCIRYNETNQSNKIRIINLSLGSTPEPFPKENDDPMVRIVERAWKSGIVVCAAAGNEGSAPRTISSPGISDRIITVGASDDHNTIDRKDDNVANFSSRGATIYGVTKPDLLAPGVNIISLRAPKSYLDRTQKSSRVGTDYFMLSGTSMATPICAGVCALILQRNPNINPDEVKKLLKNGADLWRNVDPNTYGAGHLNAENSVPK